MPANNDAAGSPQQAKVQPWKAAWPPTNPVSQTARPRILTSADGAPMVDLAIIIILAAQNSDPAEFSDLLADGTK